MPSSSFARLIAAALASAISFTAYASTPITGAGTSVRVRGTNSITATIRRRSSSCSLLSNWPCRR